MRISELSERTGVSVATIKYYLREGLLQPGQVKNVRHSTYDAAHVARLKLIRGLVKQLGTSIEQIRKILAIVDNPDQSPMAAMEQATAALTADKTDMTAESSSDKGSHLAADVLEKLHFRYNPDSVHVQQFNDALLLAEEVGLPIDQTQIEVYAQAAREIAQADFARIPWDKPQQALEIAVLGTAMYEPILLALRHLAHDEQGFLLTDHEEK